MVSLCESSSAYTSFSSLGLCLDDSQTGIVVELCEVVSVPQLTLRLMASVGFDICSFSLSLTLALPLWLSWRHDGCWPLHVLHECGLVQPLEP